MRESLLVATLPLCNLQKNCLAFGSRPIQDKEEKERLRGTYILALRNLGELEFTAKNLAGILAQEKPNEFEFEELANPLLGLKSFPWEFIELMNKAHTPSGEAALVASLGKPPSTCNFT